MKKPPLTLNPAEIREKARSCYLTAEELGVVLNMPYQMVLRETRNGRLPSMKISASIYRYDLADVESEPKNRSIANLFLLAGADIATLPVLKEALAQRVLKQNP
jgi:hypothetical protein